MAIHFERNNYFYRYTDRDAIRPAGDREIIKQVREQGLQLEYGSVTYYSFDSRFRSDLDDLPCYLGYCIQPIFALPRAAWCAVVQTIYHLALILFDAISTMLCMPPSSDYASYLQAQCFYLVRDLQESFGWLVSIINESYGMYHVQEGEFQKSCYSCYLVDEKVYDPEAYFTRQVENYLAEGDREKALTTARECNQDLQGKLFHKIALAYCDAGELDNALRLAEDPWFDQRLQKVVFEIITLAHCGAGNLDTALSVADKIWNDRDMKEGLFEKIALAHCNAGSVNKALEVIRFIYNTSKERAVLEKVVLICLDKNMPDKALEVIGQMSGVSYDTKNNLIEKVAHACFALGSLDKALEVIKKLSYETKKQELFTAKVVKELLNRRERVRAVSIIEGLSDAELQNSLFVKVALSYYADANDDMVQKIVAKMLHCAFKEEMSRSYQILEYQKTLGVNQDGVDNLFSDLATTCCDRLKFAFSIHDEEAILQRINETATAPSTMVDFLKLKPQPKPESKGSSYSSYDYSSGFNSGSSHSYDRKYEDEDYGFDNFWNGFFGWGSSKPRSSHSAHHSARAEFTSEESSDSTPAPKPSVNIAAQYAILGLSNGATKEQVKKAFRNYCTTKHPDKVAESDKKAAEERFKDVNNAYDALRTYLNF